ncbi:DUF4037 domain-containing protein [Bailinhaonella thermotolerans]|uniref:DUF4037 domain-containing protein n=2 Tax=Bailinhaonella thermotolerans TaxID=1070861 RepID=A0A3A4BDI2_9ACTN|nr:DUF4037 domain-containing protein [Bailinhaonella thermotolerans]
MTGFMPGLELSRRFYAEAVRPALDTAYPGLPHAAALVGAGSEVLGFDTPRSADREWGPRLHLFLTPADRVRLAPRLTAALTGLLPADFRGYPTRVARAGDAAPRLQVVVTDVGRWFGAELGFDPRREPGLLDWLATPWQRLAGCVGGEVFHDDLGELTAVRERLAWYPRELWSYVLACQWQRVAREEGFMARSGEAGDELGSAVVAGRLARDLMRLCLLARRRYPPYAKWLGSAFRRVPGTAEIGQGLARVLAAPSWREREEHLCAVYRRVAGLHNRLGLTEPLDPEPRALAGRPFRVLGAERFSQALLSRVTDARIRGLPPVGCVDQFADSADVLEHPARARAAARALLGLPSAA